MNDHILKRLELPGSAIQLALLRIFLGIQIFYAASSKLFDLLQHVTGSRGTKTVFPAFFDDLIAAIAVPYLVIATQVLAILLIVGLFTRYILPILFISFLLLFSYSFKGFNAPVQWIYIWFPLLILCFSRSSDQLSLDRFLGLLKIPERIKINEYRWPIELCVGWFAYIYFAAGIAKVVPVAKGIGWIGGGTSQSIIYYRFLDSPFYYIFGQPFFDYSTNQWIFGALSAGALLLELFCVVLFLTGKYHLLVLCLITSMHFFLYMTGVAGFMQTALILGIALIAPHYFPDYKKSMSMDNIGTFKV